MGHNAEWREDFQKGFYSGIGKRTFSASPKGPGAGKSTLASMVNLALAFLDQGQWKEAKELNLQVVEANKKY
jgi:hypothetical protein